MNKNQFYTFLFFILPLIYFFSLPIETGDLAIWVAEGKKILNSGTIHNRDSFSFLVTTDLFYPLFTVYIYAFIEKYFSLIGVSIFHKLILILFLFQFYFVFQQENKGWNFKKFTLFFIAMWGVSFVFIDRPAMLALPLFLFSFGYINRIQSFGLKELLFLNIINIIWVNIHGSWLILICLVAIKLGSDYLLARKNNLWQWSTLISLIITSGLNVNGFKVFELAIFTAQLSKLRRIDEWNITFGCGKYFSQILFFYFIFLIGIWIQAKKSIKNITYTSLTFFFFLIFGVFAIRNTIWSFIIFPIFIVSNYENLLIEKKEVESKKSKLNLLISFFILLSLYVFLPQNKTLFKNWLHKSKAEVYSANTPLQISKYLSENKKVGNIFNQWELGSYLAFAQNKKIFIDTRNIIFSESDFELYKKIASGLSTNFNEEFDKLNVKFVVINKSELKNLFDQLSKDAKNWDLKITENNLVLFEKRA